MKTTEKYRQNEDLNAHCENALLLANAFGTESEIAHAKFYLRERNRRGYSLPEAARFQGEMAEKYLPAARIADAAPELLNMLRRVMDEYLMRDPATGPICPLTLEHARAAIAKAEGKA